MIAHVGIVIPANDEQQLIADCLASVRRACARLRTQSPSVTIDVIVVLDSCRDATPAVVADFAEVRPVAVEYRCVGMARQAGAATARALAATRGVAPDKAWVANTDADSVVPSDWLTRAVALADLHGADVVAGTVVPDAGLAPGARAVWLAAHDLHDGHRHVHGANLGVRLSTLAALGGWSPLPVHEDVDLVSRAELAGRRVVRTAALTVRTSARTHSRIGTGFAGYLRATIDDGPGTEVAGAV